MSSLQGTETRFCSERGLETTLKGAVAGVGPTSVIKGVFSFLTLDRLASPFVTYTQRLEDPVPQDNGEPLCSPNKDVVMVEEASRQPRRRPDPGDTEGSCGDSRKP